jgi:hypothetical protein
MAKKQRRRERARHASEGSAPRPAAAVHDRPATSAQTTRRSYAGSMRAGSAVRAGAARAIGEPSPTLEKAAAQERSFVVRDFRRIGIVVAIVAALLVVSDVVVNLLVP